MVEVFVLLVPPVLLLALVVLSLEPHAHRHMDPMAEKGDHELPLDSELLNDALPDPLSGASYNALESVLDPHYIDYYCINVQSI